MIDPKTNPRPLPIRTPSRKQPTARTRGTGVRAQPIVRSRCGGGYRILRAPKVLEAEE
jgi:hypothetical protein